MGMETASRRPWARVWVLLSTATVVAVVFATWEMIAHTYFRDLNYRTLHFLYMTRSIALALLLTAWAVCIVLAHRRTYSAQLRQSDMNYRRLIEEALRRQSRAVVDHIDRARALAGRMVKAPASKTAIQMEDT